MRRSRVHQKKEIQRTQVGLTWLTFGPDDVAVILRATGANNERTVDQVVVNVLAFGEDRVASIVTHLSDIEGFNAYFS